MLFLYFMLSLPPAEPEWRWPIDTKFGVTGSFGEYRGRRFHMGVDFSTGGVEGMKIKPARDGVIFRIRATVNGFGRVVYMRHGDGLITVYAHLARFGPKLEAYLRDQGLKPLDYFGERNLALNIGVDDLLAYSGESGAGLPHLHFEVRDAQNRPLNPLSFAFPGLKSLDGEPKLDGLWLIPLDEHARVNGGHEPFWTKSGARVQAKGAVGVLAAAYVAGVRGSRLGVGAIAVSFEGQALGSWKPEHLDFAYNGDAGYVHDQKRSGFGPTRYAYCFDHRADYMPDFDGYRRQRRLVVEKEGRLTVTVTNLAERSRTFSVRLDPDAPALPVNHPLKPPPIQATSLEMKALGDRLWLKGGIAGRLQLSDSEIPIAVGERHRVALKPGSAMRLTWRTEAGNLSRDVALLQGRLSLGEFHIDARKMRSMPAQVVFIEPADPNIHQAYLRYRSPVLRFGDEGLPAKGLTLTYKDDAEHLGIYAWSYTRGRWRHQQAFENGAVETEIQTLQPLVIAVDTSPPSARKPKFHNYFVGRRVIIPLSDRGSGVDPASIQVTARGEAVAFEYDRDRGWVILRDADPPLPVTLSFADRAGHRSRVTGLRP